jgi:hypothetical protein
MTRIQLLVFALGLSISPASAHSWYDQWCCNDKDCQPLAPGDVVEGPAGYTIKGQYFVPYLDKAIKPSQDPDYHWCEYPKGVVRCFYVPGGAG